MRGRRDMGNGFEKWGGYMNAKMTKLEDQFAEMDGEKGEDIFRGMSVFVNGYTSPSADELRTLMCRHGGVYHHYYRPGRTDVIIASNLADAIAKRSSSAKIVKPEWVVDCIQTKTLLDPRRYLLQDSAADPGFLTRFYDNSRLHHISQLAGKLKAHVNRLRSESEFAFPPRDDLRKIGNAHRAPSGRTVMHVDMDCFFVSVGLRSRPHLRGLPVAVTHARGRIHSESMSEVASCSYEARAFGVRNGMFLGKAMQVCPDLKTMPYDFEAYEEVSYTLYDTVAQYTLDIEAVSCDEMFVDCTELLRDVSVSPLEFGGFLRAEIRRKTGCPCSTGFGENRLQARLATKKAKPDGQFCMNGAEAEKYLSDVPSGDLPGVGPQMRRKLESLGYSTCEALRDAPLATLQRHFGDKKGRLLFDFCRGKDPRPFSFTNLRKSISASANYGIRFSDEKEYIEFMTRLSKELHSRMLENNVKGRCLTMKLMVRAADAPVATAKFMGHGVCDNVTKTQNMTESTDSLETITGEVLTLCRKFDARPEDMRGISVQMSKLDTDVRKTESDKSDGIQKFFDEKKVNRTETEKAVSKSEPKVHKIETDKPDGIDKFFDVEVTKRDHGETNHPLQKRKRGRPLKNRSLHKYVPPKTSTVGKSKSRAVHLRRETVDIAKLGIDREVFDALPEDIQKEILASYRQPLETDKRNTPVKNKETTNEHTVIAPSSPILSKSVFKGLNRDDIETMFTVGSSYSQSDVDDVKLYFENMINAKKIEDVYSLLNFMHRASADSGRCDWHRMYFEAVESVQRNMIKVYGKRMALFDEFDCCSEENR